MISTVAGMLLILAAAAPDTEARDAKVKGAIDKGVEFLVAQQEADGGWRYDFNHNHDLGITALAGLALLENGVERDDPTSRRPAIVVRELRPARSDV